MAQVTVFRTSKADLESLLRALMKLRGPKEKRASKVPKEVLKTGSIMGPGLEAGSLSSAGLDDSALGTPGAPPTPGTPGSVSSQGSADYDANYSDSPHALGVTRNLGAVARARKSSVEGRMGRLSVAGDGDSPGLSPAPSMDSPAGTPTTPP